METCIQNMETKIKLKEFLNLQKCQDFINEFSSNKKVIRKEVIPVMKGNVRYLILLEYYEKK